jgi:AraC-like DNA-binding protein
MEISPPLALVNAAHYHQPPGTNPKGPVTRPGIERVEVITGGRGWVDVAGDWLEVVPGMLLWHRAGERTIGRSDPDSPYHCLSVTLAVRADETGRRAPRITWWKDLDELRAFTAEVARWNTDPTFDRQALLDYTYGRLIFQVRVWERTGLGQRLPAGLRRALDLIRTDYARELPLESLAEAAGWSVPHLHEVFRAHLGQTPHQALLERRLDRARELLAATDLPVKWIAAECGFAGSAAFCQVFRKRVGLTPSDFRRQETFPG